jgi:transcriptional regulator with XRE-family HTH domain|tara:strand:- start:2285 stop:2911 length:627 start_codon:yes stop_codon:yes gene_type:complete
MAARVRERAKELNFNATSLGSALKLKPSAMGNYWNGKRAYPTEALPRMAEALSTNVEYLLSGRRIAASAVADVEDAEWEDIPFFDLRNVTDTGKGEPQSWTPFRKDWLNRTLGTSFDLYLVRLLSDYRSRLGDRDLQEGDLVFVREITPAELIDGHVVIWRREGGLKVARYSLQQRDREEGDVIYPGEVSDDQFVPICRIYGKFLQRI